MSNKLKKHKKQKESLSTAAKHFFAYLLDGMICVYMLLIIVGMPFYHEQGFSYIGTNKSMFFRNVSVNGAKFILPTLVLYLIFWGMEHKQSRRKTAVDNAEATTKQQEQSLRERWGDIWKTCRKYLSVTDMFAILYGVSLLLSYAFSEYKEPDAWGTLLWGSEGWYMGLLTQLFLLGIYFLVSRCWNKRAWVFMLFLPVSAVVFSLGYLNRFGIHPIDMRIHNPEFLSTIGNINWYCGYLVSVFFGGYYLLWTRADNHKTDTGLPPKENLIYWGKKFLLFAYVAIGFATLVTQGSLSGLVTLGFLLVVTFCMSASDGRRMLGFWQGTLLLSLACVGTWCLRNVFRLEFTYIDTFVDLLTDSVLPMIALVISLLFVIGVRGCNARGKYPTRFFIGLKWLVGGGVIAGVCVFVGLLIVNTLHPGSIGALSENPFFTFTPDWGSNRGATWKAGWMCFAEQNLLHKVVGVGPDAMEAFISQNGSAELRALVTERFGTNRLTNAHCEWLTILVNTGLIGFVGYVGMMVSAIIRYAKAGKRNVIIGACGFCLLAYTINNMFSFQQSMSVATIFIIFGIGEAYARAYASYTI